MAPLTLASILGGLLYLIVYVPYIVLTFQGKTEPAFVSWLVWTVADSLLFAGMFLSGTATPQILVAMIGVWIMTILTWKRGTKEWGLVDKICLFLGLLGCVVLRFVPAASIVIAALVNTIAAVPTIVSSWKDPRRESRVIWLIATGACLITTSDVKAWTIDTAVQPIVFLLINGVVAFVLVFRRHKTAALPS